jgi:HK97 gp10 family phage protein
VAKFEWRGAEILRKVKQAQREALQETGEAIVREAKNRVRVDSGKLRDSIKVQGIEETGNGLTMLVGSDDSDVEYAAINELGGVTSDYEAQPFMRPAADIETPKLPERIQKRL